MLVGAMQPLPFLVGELLWPALRLHASPFTWLSDFSTANASPSPAGTDGRSDSSMAGAWQVEGVGSVAAPAFAHQQVVYPKQ